MQTQTLGVQSGGFDTGLESVLEGAEQSEAIAASSPAPQPGGGPGTGLGAWLEKVTGKLGKGALSGLLGGGALLLVSTTVVNLGNYVFNLILGRWLGPAAFADLTLVVTLMLVLTLITATLQTVVAKFSADYTARDAGSRLAGLRRWAVRWAGWLGLGLGGGMILAAQPLQHFFHMTSAWPFVLLGIGIPVYFIQGADRGVLQGQMRFGLLAASYQAEMWVRLLLGVGLVALGFGVNGAVGALTLSFLAAWVVARLAGRGMSSAARFESSESRAALAFALPASAALVGQILINNSDVLIVKHFFVAQEAGLYAALALIGRMVFFATWPVVTVLLPAVAQRHQQGLAHRNLFWLSLGGVLAVSAGVTGAAFLFPEMIIGLLFGEAYLSIAPLLGLYAVATTLYALSNVVIIYHLSIGNGRGGLLAVLGGALQVGTLWFVHSSLAQVIWVQIGLMAGLLAALLVWDQWKTRNAV